MDDFSPIIRAVVLLLICGFGAAPSAKGDLRWEEAKKQDLRVRLIALSLSDPRSSFFSTHEVFVAAQQLTENETRLVKLVYTFLPYQPRLSEYGLDYSLVHEVRAIRDQECDQTLAQMTFNEKERVQEELKYSTDSPVLNTSRRHSPLPCYTTNADDYTKAVHQPANPESE